MTEPIELRVVPLTGLTGAPGDGPAVAARFEPDGAFFGQPLRLVIRPGTAIPREQRFMFVANHDGTGVRPAAIDPRAADATLLLGHFSIAGMAGVNDSTFDAAFGVQRGDTASSLQQQINEVLQGSGRAGIDATAELTRLLDEFDRTVAQPALDAIAGGPNRCSLAKHASAVILDVIRYRSMFGLPPSSVQFESVMRAAYKDCEREAIRRCKQQRKPDPLVQFWLQDAKQWALLGVDTGMTAESAQKRARAICVPRRYSARGHGDGIVITGTVPDLSRPFVLTGSGEGFVIQLSYTPDDDAGMTGRMTYEGSGGGVPMAGRSTYRITGDPEKSLTLTQVGNGCAGTGCDNETEIVELTPLPD